jgi:hypothetical protein
MANSQRKQAQLTVELDGARALLALLVRVQKGSIPIETELQSVVAANKFFLDFYCQWKGVNLESLKALLYRFNQPEWKPSVPVLAALAKGFRQVAKEAHRLQTKLDSLKNVNPSAIADQVLAHLPGGTPLQSTIHITIDGFNGGFQDQGKMGLSLLSNVTDPARFASAVAHELHHVGFMYWAERDPIRQTVLKERSGHAIAMRHVQNLLAEGLAIFYCSSDMPMDNETTKYGTKLAIYRREETSLFAQAEDLLRLSLASDADFEACSQAFEAIAIDPDGILPIAHYLGARMVEVMDRFHPHEWIIECVQSLQHFLPLYNQAAQNINAFSYDPIVVEQFCQIWRSCTPVNSRAG